MAGINELRQRIERLEEQTQLGPQDPIDPQVLEAVKGTPLALSFVQAIEDAKPHLETKGDLAPFVAGAAIVALGGIEGLVQRVAVQVKALEDRISKLEGSSGS